MEFKDETYYWVTPKDAPGKPVIARVIKHSTCTCLAFIGTGVTLNADQYQAIAEIPEWTKPVLTSALLEELATKHFGGTKLDKEKAGEAFLQDLRNRGITDKDLGDQVVPVLGELALKYGLMAIMAALDGKA